MDSTSKFLSHDTKFDYIVVGAGSAGAVMGARLSENLTQTVLLLEAGRSYAPSEYPEPLANANKTGGDSAHDWGYWTEPGYVGHSIHSHRGKVVGGSSAVNTTVALRARPNDFVRWKKNHGLQGWSFEEVLETFKRLENTATGDEEWHGRNGPFPIRQCTVDFITPTARAFIESAQSLGLKRVDDFNNGEAHGVGPSPINVINGVRQNTGIAYLTEEVRRRPNLTIRALSEVDRVIIQGNRAVGVRLVDGSEFQGKEIVLSAGAYGSAAILMRSGIGPKEDLRKLEIPLVTDLPVGRRLTEHPFYYTTYALAPGAQVVPAVGALIRTRTEEVPSDEVDVQIGCTHVADPAQSPTGTSVGLSFGLMRPDSIGRLTLFSRDPKMAPRIDLNLLAEERDRRRFFEGVKLSRKVGRTSPLKELVVQELKPGPSARTDKELEAVVISTLSMFSHPSCTAPMGGDNDPNAVTDSLGAVRGIEGLRVVDCSIFPEIPSSPTNLNVIMIAEHISARISM